MKQYDLTDLQAFVAVVETGSFNKAAVREATSPASISRRISSLEAALGARLLNRTTRQMSLTDSGTQYFDDVQNVLGALRESEDRLRDSESSIRGSIKLAAPLSFGLRYISPLIPSFLKQYPDMHIDLILEDQQTKLYEQGIDLALRIGKLNDSSLVATRLCNIEFGFFASPGYLLKHGEPLKPDELTGHKCLHYSLTSNSREWGFGENSVMTRGPFSANNGEALCEVAIQDLGIVALPRFLVEEALVAKQLKPILKQHCPEPVGLYALRLSRRFTPLKVKRFIEYLQNSLA